ncbi:DUF3761 domain-containing protein [Streptomyces sp. NPDC020801]|uniref:DUF3761 domain-containing protein n=1 Tax=Streptomyces sp. NPDC020801 TaxID=3365093 RepID=UPI003794AB84
MPAFPTFRVTPPWPRAMRRHARETIPAHRQKGGPFVLTRFRSALAAAAVAGALLVPVAAATPAAAASCAHHTTGVCKAGSKHPRGATAKCWDGTYSYSAHFRGTCSRHHGVRYWYR